MDDDTIGPSAVVCGVERSVDVAPVQVRLYGPLVDEGNVDLLPKTNPECRLSKTGTYGRSFLGAYQSVSAH